LTRIDYCFKNVIYLCTEFKKVRSGHKNSRQVKVTFSEKRIITTLQHFGECKGNKGTAFFPITQYIYNKFKKD
jgi:hypothetical protein